MDSPLQPYTPEQWALLNHEADAIYDDFTQKVASGRKLPLAQVQEIAKGRVWSGTDAKSRGLVDGLGGFWTAADMAAHLGGVPAGDMSLRIIPPQKSSGKSWRLLERRGRRSGQFDARGNPARSAGGSGRVGGNVPPAAGRRGTKGRQSAAMMGRSRA